MPRPLTRGGRADVNGGPSVASVLVSTTVLFSCTADTHARSVGRSPRRIHFRALVLPASRCPFPPRSAFGCNVANQVASVRRPAGRPGPAADGLNTTRGAAGQRSSQIRCLWCGVKCSGGDRCPRRDIYVKQLNGGRSGATSLSQWTPCDGAQQRRQPTCDYCRFWPASHGPERCS